MTGGRQWKKHFFDDEAVVEEARKKYALAVFLKVLWTFLTLLVLLGLLLPLTVFLGWWKFFLPCLLGLLTGVSIAAGILTSLRNRALITTLLGVLTLPGLAVYLSLAAGRSDRTFQASSAALMPFVAYALAALSGGLILGKIWRKKPVMERKEAIEKETPGFRRKEEGA